MSETRRHIEDIQKQTSADDVALGEARTRRDVTLAAGRTFGGIAGSYISGSVAAGVATDKVEDADGGLVADRRCFPTLGPDADDDSPLEVVCDLQEHVGPLVRDTYESAVVQKMKRGLRVFFNEPLADGQDPYVDMVFALQRKDAPGLWIPNMDAGRWDPAHPQKHVELLTSGTQAVRTLRARVIRLGKVWNKQFAEPALNSFNICALALESITVVTPIEDALQAFFAHAAASLAVSRTDDPAGVSGPIGLEKPKDIVLKRVRDARDALDEALANDDDPDAVQAAMHRIYGSFVAEPTVDSKDDLADRLRSGTPRLRPTVAGAAVLGTAKTTRSFGGDRG